MITKLRYYITDNTLPYQNLALEEYLLHQVGEGECILYLWQNRNTVVIGRNQNAWGECRTQELEDSGGHLVRRLSGGGAVYHDLGNLNFTFLVREADYDVNRQMSVILHAVQALGLEAELSGRNDITIHGQKFSGNAFYRSHGHCYHHGTLLVNVDMSMLSRYLQVSKSKLERKGVQSVRARVVNLTQYCPGLTIAHLQRQLVDSFGAVYGLAPRELAQQELDWKAIDDRTRYFESWQWRYGAKIPFTEQAHGHFDWGEVELRYTVDSGLMRQVALYSDGLEADFLAALPGVLEGCRYAPGAITQCLSAAVGQNAAQKQISSDLTGLLSARFE